MQVKLQHLVKSKAQIACPYRAALRGSVEMISNAEIDKLGLLGGLKWTV